MKPQSQLLSRRDFLKVFGAGMLGTALASQTQAFAASERALVSGGIQPDQVIATTCDGCGNRCGVLAQVKDGRVWRVVGNPAHPKSKGKVCARGQAQVRELYNPTRLVRPLKRNGDTFEAISWEQAYAEIAEKLKAVIAAYGPQAVYWSRHPKPVKFYEDRFLQALGSPNMVAHSTTCFTGRDVGFNLTLGTVPGADYGASKYIVLMGRNPAEGVVPAVLSGLAAARDKGAKLLVIDPRFNNTAAMADEWLMIRPGTDQALLLAWANVLVTENLYDADFVSQYVEGFDAFAEMVQRYTPEWAAEITSLDAETIRRTIREMAAVKPQAFIDPSWHGAFGSHYLNSAETARMVAIVNALLGNINRNGGIILPQGAGFGKLDEAKYPAPPKVEIKRSDGAGVKGQYPLAIGGLGIAQRIPELIEQGVYRAGFAYHYNPARTLPDRERTVAALQKLELLVVIDVAPSETAMLAHYILPESMYLERDELVEVVPGKQPKLVLRQKVVEPLGDTRPASQIITELAQAMGLGQYFNFTLDELNQIFTAPLNVDWKALRETGVADVGNPWQEGMPEKLNTPSGKVEFYSAKMEEAGFSPLPVWQAPKRTFDLQQADTFRLLHGHQSVHTHSATANNPFLMYRSHKDQLYRLWINAGRAAVLGIQEGDWVVLSNEKASGMAQAHLVQGIHPECVWLPSGYGSFSPQLKVAYGVGISPNDFMERDYEPISAHAMMAEVSVKIRKASPAEAAQAEAQLEEAKQHLDSVIGIARRLYK